MLIFKSSNDAYTIFMGKDKYENEHLIEFGWPEDVWFHVKDHSSAHVYIRMPINTSIDQIPTKTIDECCQLVKKNSIEGSKLPNVTVNYTLWSNLMKLVEFDVGTVSFKDFSKVKSVHNVRKNRELLKKLESSLKEIVMTRDQYQNARYTRDRQEIEMKKHQNKLLKQQELSEKSKGQYKSNYYTDLHENIIKKNEPEHRKVSKEEEVDYCRNVEEEFM